MKFEDIENDIDAFNSLPNMEKICHLAKLIHEEVDKAIIDNKE
jgi:hypothetical protein